MSTATTAGTDSSLNFDELFAGEQHAAGPAASGEENLEELEAFLDEFEKNLDTEAPAVTKAGAAPAEPPAATASAADAFDEPAQAEELVQGLLKEDELDLDVQAEAAPVAAATPALSTAVDEVPEFEPELAPDIPIAPPAFIHAAPAPVARAVPAAAAGFTRIGFILALVLGGVALLVAIGAGWMAWSASQAMQAMEARLETVAPPKGAPDPQVAKLQGGLAAPRQQVDGLAKVVEGPLGHVADAYQRDLEQLQNRMTELEKAASVPPPANAAPAPVAPPPQASAQPAPAPAAPGSVQPQAAPAKPAAAPAPQPKPGAWLVHLTSADEKKLAERELARARAQGITAELTRSNIDGKTWYRVTVHGFSSAEAARAYATGEAKKSGFTAAWIGRK